MNEYQSFVSLINKKAHPVGIGFSFDWWRRRESNPRPQIRYSRSYMLSLFFNLPLPLPKDRCDSGSQELFFRRSGPDDLCDDPELLTVSRTDQAQLSDRRVLRPSLEAYAASA